MPNRNTDTPCMSDPKNAIFLALNLWPTIPKTDDAMNPDRWSMPNTNPD